MEIYLQREDECEQQKTAFTFGIMLRKSLKRTDGFTKVKDGNGLLVVPVQDDFRSSCSQEDSVHVAS